MLSYPDRAVHITRHGPLPRRAVSPPQWRWPTAREHEVDLRSPQAGWVVGLLQIGDRRPALPARPCLEGASDFHLTFLIFSSMSFAHRISVIAARKNGSNASGAPRCL